MSLAGWQFFSKILANNTNNANTLTDYQVKINLDSTNSDIFNKAQTNGEDIRFLDSDNSTSLNFWIEKWDSTNQVATLLTKVPSIQASSFHTIYMYLGNPSATSASDGDATFDFFDDFEDGSYTDKWTVISGTWQEANGILTETSPSALGGIYTSSFSIGSHICEFEVRPSSDLRLGGIFGRTSDSFHYECLYNDTSYWAIITDDDSDSNVTTKSSNSSGDSLTAGTWYNEKVIVKDNGNIEYYNNGVLQVSYAETNIYNGNVGLRHWYQGTADFDNFRVRKYTSPEPTTSVGKLQTNGNAIMFGMGF